MRGHVDHRVRANLSRNKTANWILASTTKSEMVSNRAHRKRRNARPVTLSRAQRYQLKSGPIAHVGTNVVTAAEEPSELHTTQLNCAIFLT